MDKNTLLDLIDWTSVLAAPRYAGGHEEVMRSIWGPRTTVIAEWIEDEYQGEIAFAYQFHDGTIGVATDYFGSCPGCDSWEGADDNEARHMITAIVTSMRLFPDISAAKEYCQNEAGEAEEFSFRAARNLIFPMPEEG